MASATASSAPLVFEALSGLTAVIEDGAVFIANAYKVGGTTYNITYKTNSANLAKLDALNRTNPTGLITQLQEQMGAYLEASNALAAPLSTRFKITSESRVFAVKGSGEEEISDKVAPTSGKAARVFAQTFHKNMGFTWAAKSKESGVAEDGTDASTDTAKRTGDPSASSGTAKRTDDSSAPASKKSEAEEEDDDEEEDADVKAPPTMLECMRVSQGARANLLPLTQVPISSGFGHVFTCSGAQTIVGGAALGSGAIGFIQNGANLYTNIKNGDLSSAAESAVKTASSGALAIAGVATTFGAGPASMGPIAFSVAGGANLLINIKDGIMCLIDKRPLPEKWLAHTISNLCMFIGPIILLAAGLSNPFTAAILGVIALVGIVSYVYANWDTIQEAMKGMKSYHYILYAVAFAAIIAVSIFGGVPAAQYWFIPLMMILPPLITEKTISKD